MEGLPHREGPAPAVASSAQMAGAAGGGCQLDKPTAKVTLG